MTDATAPKTLVEGYRRFRSGDFRAQQSLYETLSQGQQPHTLVIACSDSRVDPAAIFNANPGELFVVRNVANLVPPVARDGSHHGVSAALEFAVKVLKVKGVVILGHAQCGGVAACAAGIENLPPDTQFLDKWLEVMLPARADVLADTAGDAGADVCDALELHSIRHSVERLKTFDFVADAIASRGLEIHGARFGIAKGQLEWLGADGEFHEVEV